MKLRHRKAAVLLENLYEDQEAWYPYQRLREEGAQVLFVAPRSGETYASKHGYPARSDAAAADVDAASLDAIVIPGGYAPDHMRRDRAMVDLVRGASEAGKVIAAICHGGWMLASAGCARGRTVTSFFAIRDDLVNAGAKWVDEEVVVDGNLITSRKPDDLPAFARAIVRALSGEAD